MVTELPVTSRQLSPYETDYLETIMTISITNNRHQSGVVLVIGLIMLLLLTIISTTAMRTTSLEERMAGNLRNYNLAFQAAESTLREAEAYINSDATPSPFNPLRLFGVNAPFRNGADQACTDGLCNENYVVTDDISTVTGTLSATAGITAPEPRYIIELLRVDPSPDSSRVYATFRITSRAISADASSVVQLQSTYRLHALSFVN